MKNKFQSFLAGALKRFLLPRVNRSYLLRIIILAVLSFLFFKFICRPAWTNGGSMLPTYQEREFLFYWQPAFWFSTPKRGDVVVIRFVGANILLLKRVVALAGESVEFRQGTLLVNGQALQEEWNTLTPCDWELPPRSVEKGKVYVVGDNRSMPIEQHEFGQVSLKRVRGKPIKFKNRKK
ncbi:MAG: signal peptidase I [Lentisphaeria bacterium]